MNLELVPILEKFLGPSKSAGKEILFYCPLCNHYKRKLSVNIDENSDGYCRWKCWICNDYNNTRGNSIFSLLKKTNAPDNIYRDVESVLNIVKRNVSYIEKTENVLSLPQEFIPLWKHHSSKSLMRKHALHFLINKRGLSNEDIEKYGIGYCEKGIYRNYVVIPSYDRDGNLNYFNARCFFDDTTMKYRNPQFSKNIVGFEMFLNWNYPIILVEGVFDAISVKRNSIPLFGTTISNRLKDSIFINGVNTIYLALDNDALEHNLKYCEYFLNQGIDVRYVELPKGKDPSDLGMENFWNLLYRTEKLTLRKIVEYKFDRK